MSEAFDKCMKRAFAEIGVTPQYNTPAWRACKHTWDAAYTACDVPYWGLIGAAFDGDERTRVISYVRAFGSIALGLATLGGPWIAKLLSFSAETTALGWSRAAILISVVGMSMFLLAFFNLLVFLSVLKSFRALRRGEKISDEDFDLLLSQRGFLSRLFRPVLRS